MEKLKDEGYQQKIARFYSVKKRMPSFSEIGELVGFSSKNSVAKLVTRLEGRGVLRRDKEGKIIPLHLSPETKILGFIEAGFPSQAEEDILDTLSLDDFLVERKEATYMLRVKGDSMRDAGIVEGDYVLVERTSDAKPGAIVIASVDGAYTMKYLRMKNGQPYLEPANPKYRPITPKGDLRIEAVVRAVIRKYT
jgi:repressor LexA